MNKRIAVSYFSSAVGQGGEARAKTKVRCTFSIGTNIRLNREYEVRTDNEHMLIN